MDTKQVIVIRKDLNMRKGKMISQGAHASMKVFFDMMDNDLKVNLPASNREEILNWMQGSFTKITVSVNSLEELNQVYDEALSRNLPTSKITDAGKTEFSGIPTVTCIAIGPAEVNRINEVTSSLKLL